MSEPLDLDALAALEAAATPGPWFWRERGVERRFGDTFGMTLNLTADSTIPGVPPPFNVGHPLNIIKADNRGVTWAPSDEDAALMVEARNALPALIERVRVAEADRDAYRARIDAVRALAEPYTRTHINHDGSVSVGAGWSLARDVLDAQAAAHAAYWDEPLVPRSKLAAAEAEVEALREQLNAAQMTADEGVEIVGELTADRDGWIEAAETYKASRDASDQRAEALRAENGRLRIELGIAQSGARQATGTIDFIRDRAIAEALEHAASVLDGADASYFADRPAGEAPWDLFTRPHAAAIVRGLIPNGDKA